MAVNFARPWSGYVLENSGDGARACAGRRDGCTRAGRQDGGSAMVSGGPATVRVAFVTALATGGTARHVGALAAGCRAAGLAVSVLAPDPTLALLDADAGIETFALRICEQPRPASDLATVARLRGRLAAWRPDVVHAHGMRAGAFAALAIAGLTIGRLAVAGLATAGSGGASLPGRRCGISRRRGQARTAGGSGTQGGQAAAPPAPRLRRPPALVVTVHNAPPAGRRDQLVYGVLERICARRADLVLCASADLAARMRNLGATNVQQFHVPARVFEQPSPDDVAKARDDVGADGRPVVLAVGRLAPQKGLDVLIEAAGRWRHRDPQPRTVIAGDGPQAAALRAQVSRANADVLLLGPRHDVPALLQVADVVVVPSRWEARALILQEAMQSGKPIVATSVGGTPDLVATDGLHDGSAGHDGGASPERSTSHEGGAGHERGAGHEYSALLIPPDDPAALAAAVTAVLDDPRLAARLRLAARARSAAFPTEKDAINLAISTYARLAASRS
jgi:glycosyltransferase involved in cell wall biosynthesis